MEEWANCRTCNLAFPELNKDGKCDLCKHVKKNDQKNLGVWLKK